MHKTGIIKKWNDEKGFGFIKSKSDKNEYFFHINSYRNSGQRPSIGLVVSFDASVDKQGRAQAVKVRSAGKEKPDSAFKAFAISASFLTFVIGVSLLGFSPKAVMWLYIVTSTWLFLLYFLDKSAAKKGKRRTAETTLHNIALIGGWPGALFARQLLRHKSKKESFRNMFWVTVVLNILAFIYLLSPYGVWVEQVINKYLG